MRTIKGFITRDGEHVNLPSGGNVVEEYTDDEASFRNSDVIGTILVAGIHQVLYKQEETTVETNHFLLVRHFTLRHPVTHDLRYGVEQCVIDESGIFKRSRVYNNEEHTDPYSEWTAWDNIIPVVTDAITEGSYNAITSGAVYNYAPRAISNAGYGVSVDEDGEISIGSDYVVIGVDGGEAEINSENIDNLNRALEDPVKTSDPQSAYSDNKLITAAAVLNKLSSRLDKPDDNLMVKFDVSGGALTLVADTTEYNNIFGLAEPGVTNTVTTFVGIHNSDDDVYTQFLGVVSVTGQYSNIDSTLEKINVTIYVGGYTIYLNKDVSSGTITVSMDSFADLLQNS